MRALVVYESMFGQTRIVAERIAGGLRYVMDDVDVVRVQDADVVRVLQADLLVVGGPTHVHGMSRPRTRQAALDDPAAYGAATTEPGAEGIGVREWFEGLPALTGAAAAFDTRADTSSVLSGRASKAIAKQLRKCGLRLVAAPESFLVTRGRLKDGELTRADLWGQELSLLTKERTRKSRGRESTG
jgi:hypothetical protein